MRECKRKSNGKWHYNWARGSQHQSMESTLAPQLRSTCTSTELPNQDDALQHFSVDDIVVPVTPCELHIPMGNTGATVLATHGIISPMVPKKTPRSMEIKFHLAIIASRWIESKTIGKWLLAFLEVMGRRPKDKQSIHSFYGASATSLFLVRRLG
jgi:hypothetical protein